MAQEIRLEDIPGIADQLFAIPDDYAHVTEGVETAAELLTSSVTLDEFCGQHNYTAFRALAETYIDPERVPDVTAEELPFLTLLSFRGGQGETYAGEVIADPFDPVPPAELACCTDAYNILGLEYADYECGDHDYFDDPSPPTSIFKTTEGFRNVYLFTTAEATAELGQPWTKSTFVDQGVVDTLGALVDIGFIRSACDAFEFDDEGMLKIHDPDGVYTAFAAPLDPASQSFEDLERLV